MNSKNEYEFTLEWIPDHELQIDKICDAFELSFQRNEQPRIEDYLDETLGDVSTQLAELLMVELAYRKKAGDTPTLDEYVSRFPSFSDVLRGLSDQFELDGARTYGPPPVIENLESFEFLGAGAFGSVWKAWDTRLHRFVAIKTPIRPVPSKAERELIQREARIVAKAKHPHVVPVHSCGEKEGRIYIVYEFVPGTTLRERLKSGPYSQQDAAVLCLQIAQAVHHVHQLGIVHRDLKPANILIDPVGLPHVMDFGLAKLVDTHSTIGITDKPLGTPAYMSPEQALGKSSETDARSDIYSLGVILYELLAGQPVFGGSRYELMRQIQSAAPPPLCKTVPEISPDLELICLKCLEKGPLDRYPTAADLAADLQRFIKGEPILARPVSRRVHAWRWLKKRRYAAILTVIAVLPLCAWVTQKVMPGVEKHGRPQSNGELQGQPQPNPSPVPSAVAVPWTVLVTTKPAGAHVRVIPRDADRGELLMDHQSIASNVTPVTLQLLPAMYQVEVVMPGDVRRSQQVDRIVPPPGANLPLGSGKPREYLVVGHQSLEWPVILIPDQNITDGMVYVEGTEAFPVGGDAGRTAAIAPFYVSPREFTFGDFLKLRPGSAGNVPEKPAFKQPPDNTMSETWYSAAHWAEEAGGRLLTELEFEYLATLAAEAELVNAPEPNDEARFHVAGGSSRDAIPTKPPILGILSGYAEWTSSRPNQSQLFPQLSVDVPTDHRIVRGGTLNAKPNEFKRDPRQRTAAPYFNSYPTVGFRVARSAALAPNEGK